MDSTVSNWEEEAGRLRNAQLEYSLEDNEQEVMCQGLVTKTLPLILLQDDFWQTNKTTKQQQKTLVLRNNYKVHKVPLLSEISIPQ